MVIFPTCKINLGLSVIEKRDDGFHNIETILYPIPLKDVLEIVPSGKFHFSGSGLNIPGDPADNLVVKACRLIDKEHGIGPVQIHLHKVVPAGAGLGGGSSDAAHAIMALNDIFSLGLSMEEMEDYARQLGSDCAFFIRNKPVLAYEKGDRFKPIDLRLDNYSILLVKPAMDIPTSLAYGLVKASGKSPNLSDIIKQPVAYWQDKLINNFETPVFARYPEIQKIKLQILKMGAVYASMTGSGSAVLGIFKQGSLAGAQSQFPGCFTWHN